MWLSMRREIYVDEYEEKDICRWLDEKEIWMAKLEKRDGWLGLKRALGC